MATGAGAQGPALEYKNKVVLLAGGSIIKDLERTTLSWMAKSTALGAKTYVTAEGDHASVIYHAGQRDAFMVRIAADIDPEEIIRLYQFTVAKGMRRINTMKAQSIERSKIFRLPTVSLRFQKVEEGTYIITPATPLENGEYLFTIGESNTTGFAFSAAKG